MKKTCKSLISLLLSALLLFTPVFADGLQLSGAEQYNALSSVSSFIEIYYKFGADAAELRSAAFREKLVNPDADLARMIEVMMSKLDPHSSYLNKDDYKRLIEQSIEGEFCGIGVSIAERSGRVVVISPIKGSPAEAAGVKPNDIIFSVGGEIVLGKSVEYIQSLILGEEGTAVKVGFLRGSQIIDLELVRSKIRNSAVSHKVLEDNIGYLSVSSFNKTTPEDTRVALKEFDEKGINKVVIDLRYNPGGELNSAIEFANIFLPKGPVAKIEHRYEQNNEIYYSTNTRPKYKIAVLVNEGSASASELFSAAVKDTKAGKLFGTTTYGKGTMQTIMPYPLTGGALRLTIAEFLSPNGNTINEVGVEPDYYIFNKTRKHDASHLLPFDITKEYRYGDRSEDIRAIQQRLSFLNYYGKTPNGMLDTETFEAIKTYQAYNSLNVTGTINLETALHLNNIDYENILFNDDLQLEGAIEYLKKL